ncbi:hypothetical protein AMECASPLE_013349 [Ameca splendens]|uniref:Uncharacterized protein n=1 Tax=Ameca splendens TaxID=208324 RepID=A0ABV0XEF5_9TELE
MRLRCCPVRQAGNGTETSSPLGFTLLVTSELQRLLSCMCQNVRPQWMAPTTTSKHAPYELDGVLTHLLPHLDRSITELLNSLRCNLGMSDGPKHDVTEIFYWI